MRKLNINPDSISKVAISHGHMDHVRGILALLKTRTVMTKIPIYGHPNIIEPKRAFFFGLPFWNAGFPKLTPEQEDQIEFHFNREPVEIEPNVFLSGEIPLEERKEERHLSKYMWHNFNGKWEHDPMLDEQFLILKTKEGLVVLSGCCHTGISNAISKITDRFDDEIHTFIGGIHMIKSGMSKVARFTQTIQQKFSHIKFYLNHSTGIRTMKYLERRLGNEHISRFHVGSKLTFEI
jgi:7,8-dihydropterin-6-yl-methyl-4-(beta-D-ribofuranosyl)aminobenzene 5'-phosphate synthase